MTNYIFDLQKIIEFITQKTNNNTNSEITETWVSDESTDNTLSLVSKELHEAKGDFDNSNETIRYDLIKTLISYLSNPEFDMDENNNIKGTFFQKLIFESFKSSNLIKENNGR